MGKGRAPCCDKIGLKKGSWTPAEDMRLMAYIRKHGHGNWRALPKKAGLLRCGKSCRLRWINYLRPDIKRGNFTKEEEDTIIELHHLLGNKWSKIASHLPGRTDNEIKNVWNTHLKKRLNQKDPPPPPPPSTPSSGSCSSLCEETISTGGVWPDINNIPDACNMTKQDASEDGIMEISLLSNLQTWDILEGQTSSFSSSPTSNTNNDVDRRLLWNMEFNDHLHYHHAPQPPPLTDVRPKPTPSSSPTRISGATVPPQLFEDTKCAFDSQRLTVQATHNMEKSAAAAAEADGVEGIGTWIEYLERELDLWCGSDQQSVLTDLVEPPTMTCCEDFDPITSYFHNSPLY